MKESHLYVLKNLKSTNTEIVRRKDGTLVEMRAGYRPRVLSRAEVESREAAANAKKDLNENPFATMTNPPRTGGSYA